MSKVYVLTEGSYSDYHIIIGVFTSEQAGKLAQKEFGGDFEEYELDEPGKDNRIKYQVWIKDGSTKTFPYHEIDDNPTNEVEQINYIDGKVAYRIYVMAEDKDHAVKIASELVAQYKALGEVK